jgi:hypothetical protein
VVAGIPAGFEAGLTDNQHRTIFQIAQYGTFLRTGAGMVVMDIDAPGVVANNGALTAMGGLLIARLGVKGGHR